MNNKKSPDLCLPPNVLDGATEAQHDCRDDGRLAAAVGAGHDVELRPGVELGGIVPAGALQDV